MIALIPVNRLDRAKGRLSEALSAEERVALTLITLDTVVAAAFGAGLQPRILTAETAIRGRFAATVEVLDEDPRLTGLNAQLERGIAGLADVVVIHADLPLATAARLERVVHRAPVGPSVTVVRSGDGGTNVMAVRPPGRFALAYGPGSCAIHRGRARAAGMAVGTVRSPALSVDLDTPADLARLLSSREGRASAAGRYLIERGGLARFGGG